MSTRRSACLKCTAYDRQARRCAHRKANPGREIDAVELVERLGLQALCALNPYRDRIAARMLGVRGPGAAGARPTSPDGMTVEILDDDSRPGDERR